jgi:hypothetical protein
MSDSNRSKKMVEEQHLAYFLEAYRIVTGSELTFVGSGESPDFICARASGELVGVELARSPHDHERAVDDRIWGDGTMESYDLLDAIGSMIAAKQRKREAPHWRTPNNTILVIDLLDYSFDSLCWTEDLSLSDDYASTGFIEIWIADHSTLEAFREVRLIGLYPSHLWGLHSQPALQGKPFG